MQGFSENLQQRNKEWVPVEQDYYQTGEGNSRRKRKSTVKKSQKKRKTPKKIRLDCRQTNRISSYPAFFIVNLDSRELPGSHWIAIGLFKHKLEIFDSLGFKLFDWPRVPCNLLNFLLKFSIGRKVHISDQMQSLESNYCAFYCLFYVIFRNIASFNKFQHYSHQIFLETIK